MNMRQRLWMPAIGLAMLGVYGQASAADDEPINARWNVQEISYSYVGFTTAYSCDAAEDKIKAILTTLGAHESTRVRATGCPNNRPSRNFFVTITSATPIPATELKQTREEKSRQELLQRLGKKNELLDQEFPATWKSVSLSDQRRLNLQPGDCELMEGLRDKVLPKLGIKIEEQRISCTPNQLGLQPPYLRVSALMPLASPDAKTGQERATGGSSQ